MNPVLLASLIPLLSKAPKVLKALYASKHFWPAAIGAGFVGQEALNQVGKSGERKLSREQIALQKVMAEASAEATKQSTKESRANTAKYIKELTKARREEAKQQQESEMMASFLSHQDRQMALIMQAMGTLSNRPAGSNTQSPAGGMLGMMRGDF